MSKFLEKGLLKQAQKLQAKMEEVTEELDNTTLEASSGGGAVKVVITGQQRVCSITISPEVCDAEDVGLLEDLVLTAVNEAIEKSRELATDKFNAIGSGLGLKIPGLF